MKFLSFRFSRRVRAAAICFSRGIFIFLSDYFHIFIILAPELFFGAGIFKAFGMLRVIIRHHTSAPFHHALDAGLLYILRQVGKPVEHSVNPDKAFGFEWFRFASH
jgi:hypothetical protein